jgi:hypothetical protein
MIDFGTFDQLSMLSTILTTFDQRPNGSTPGRPIRAPRGPQVLPKGSCVAVIGGPQRLALRGQAAHFQAWQGNVDADLEAALAHGATRAVIAGTAAADSDAGALVAARRLVRARDAAAAAAAAAGDQGPGPLHVVVSVRDYLTTI